MSVPQKPSEHKGRLEQKGGHRPKSLPVLDDWDFWRFLIAALGLLWDIVKTTVLK